MANKKLSALIQIGGTVAASFLSSIKSTKGQLGELGKTIQDLSKKQRLLGSSIQTFGKIGKNVDGLRKQYADLTEQLNSARRAQEKLINAQTRAAKIGGVLRGAAVATGAAVGASAIMSKPLIGAAISRENEIALMKNTGAKEDEIKEMMHAAEKTRQFGVSITEAMHVVGQLRAAFGDAHHAVEALPLALKAKSGLQLYDRLHGSDLANGDSAYTLAKIAEERGGGQSPEAMAAKFNWAFKGLTGSGGHVGIADWLNAVRSGKGAVRAMDDASFFGDTFLMQSMGADRYGTASSSLSNGWIAGRATHSALQRMTDLGLMDKDKVQLDKTGKVKSAVGALVDSQLFIKDPQAWVDKYLIPTMKANGVDVTDAAQVNEFAAQIASNSNASAILVNRVLDSKSIAKDRRNVMNANGVNESDLQNQLSTAGKIENARKRLNDAEERAGVVLLPILAGAMEKVSGALESVNHFAEESPATFKLLTFGIIGTTAAITGLTAVGITAKLATTGLTTAMNLLPASAAAASAGVMGFIGKLGMAGLLAGVALDAARAMGLPDTDAEKGRAAVQRGDWWTASKYLPAGEFISSAWNGMTSSSAPPKPKASQPPALPSMPWDKVNPAPSYVSNEITIMQQPGQDSRALARMVAEEIERKNAAAARSKMYDGAGAR